MDLFLFINIVSLCHLPVCYFFRMLNPATRSLLLLGISLSLFMLDFDAITAGPFSGCVGR